MLLTKNWLGAFVLLLVLLLVLPPVYTFIKVQFGWSIHPLLRIGFIALLLFVFVRLLLGGDKTSEYKSPEVKARFMEIYDEKMND